MFFTKTLAIFACNSSSVSTSTSVTAFKFSVNAALSTPDGTNANFSSANSKAAIFSGSVESIGLAFISCTIAIAALASLTNCK